MSGLVIDGAAIGFLLFTLYYLRLNFQLPEEKRHMTWEWGILSQRLGFFVGSGMAVGWLWP